MNSPSQNRGHLPYYRSQVATLTSNNSPTSLTQNKNNFKQSLVPDLTKKYHEYERKQSLHNLVKRKDQLLSQRNYVKGYQNLLSSKTKNYQKSPLNTYRTIENLSPRSPRQNMYTNDRECELQQNRSVKFISKLREQINSPLRKYQNSKNTNKNYKDIMSPSAKRQNQTLVQSSVKQQSNYSPQIIKQIQNSYGSEQNIEISQSPQRETFERKLIDKCKSLQFELQSKDRQIQRLTQKLHSLQQKQVSQINLLKNQYVLQKSKKESQLQIATKQLQQLQKSIKNLQKSKNTKQKALVEQVSKYAKQLKQSQQQRNKMVLQFQSILKQKVQARQKTCSDQVKNDLVRLGQENKNLKQQINDLSKQIQGVRQQREDIFEQSKLLNLQLQNYTKWNEQLSQQMRNYQRKCYELQSGLNLYKNQKSIYQLRIKELQQQLQVSKSNINRLQSSQCMLSQQIQIFRFEVQSLRNQMQSKQKQYLHQKLMYVQQIQILDSRYLSGNKQKIQICQQLDYQRKQLSNMRRLVDSLQDRLDQQRRQYQQVDILKDKYSLQLKQKTSSYNKIMQQMIYKDNQLSKYLKKHQQMEEQITLAKRQTSYNHQLQSNIQNNHSNNTNNKNIKYKCQNNQKQQQISQQNVRQQNNDNTDNTYQCIQRIQQLQRQLGELMMKFRQQKKMIMNEYQRQKQQMRKRILQTQKQLFRKQQCYIDDKHKYSIQLSQKQQKITQLQQLIKNINKQSKILNQQINVKQIKIKYLIKSYQQLQIKHNNKIISKQQQLNHTKNILTQDKYQIQNVLFKLIYNSFDHIQQYIRPRTKLLYQQNCKTNIISQTSLTQNNFILNNININQQNQFPNSTPSNINKQIASDKLRLSPQRRKLSPQKNINNSNPSKHNILSNNKRLNQHQLSIQFMQRTRQITSFINLLNKKVSIYEYTIGSLQQTIRSQPVKMQQQYMIKIRELQNKVQIYQNQRQMNKEILNKDLQNTKLNSLKQISKMKQNLQEKNKQNEQLLILIQKGKKRQQQIQQRLQIKQNEHKKILKKLNNDIEEYKNVYNILKQEKQQIQKQNQQLKQLNQNKRQNIKEKRKDNIQYKFDEIRINDNDQRVYNNNLSSMTTINRQVLFPTVTNLNLNKTPCKLFRGNMNINQRHANLSLQQIVQYRLNELTMQNQHLSNQLQNVNNELMKQKQMFIEVNYIIKQFQKQISNISQQNQKLKQQCYQYQIKSKQLNQQLCFLQQQNISYQTQIQSQSKTINQSSNQLQKIKNQLYSIQTNKQQLQRQLTNINQLSAQKYVDIKKYQDQSQIQIKLLQSLQLEKNNQIKQLHKLIQEKQSLYKQQTQKKYILQKIYSQLLQWIQKQPFLENIKKYSNHKNTSFTNFLSFSQQFSNISPNLSQYQKQTINSLTYSFTTKLQSLQHTIQQLQTINQGLKLQIQRQKSQTDQKQLQIMKKQRQIDTIKERALSLQKAIQRLQVQVEEWKFICESNSLNKSLSLQHKWIKQSIASKQNSSSAFNKNFAQSHVQYPQKGTSSSKNRSKSPLKSPPHLRSYQQKYLSPNRIPKESYSNLSPVTNTPNFHNQNYQLNLKNSVDSISSVGQFYEYQKGKNGGNSSGQMSFF